MTVTSTQKTAWDNMDAIKLQAFDYEALILPEWGANVISLTCQRDEVFCNILRTPQNADELKNGSFYYGIPILFPANRIQGGTYTYDGVRYSYPINFPKNIHIHGVLHNNPWTLISLENNNDYAKATLEIKVLESPAISKCIPIDIVFQIENVLSKDGLLQRFRVINNSANTFPFGLAYHTVFNLAFADKADIKDVLLHAPLQSYCQTIDEIDWLPDGSTVPLNSLELAIASPDGTSIAGHFIDGLYTAAPNTTDAVITDMKTNLEVVYRGRGDCHYWILSNRLDEEGFIFIEPQTWMSNALAMDPSKYKERGVIMIEPQSMWEGDTSIFIR